MMSVWLCALALAAPPHRPVPPIHTIDEMLANVPQPLTPPTDDRTTITNNVPVHQRSITSKASPAALKMHFLSEFTRYGLYLAPEVAAQKPQVGEMVTGLDTEHLLSYTIFLQPNPRGTTVVLTCADMSHLELAPASEAVAPVYPGGTSVTAYRMEGTQVMTYEVQATPAELKTFYRDTYAKQGFKETEELLFAKGEKRVQVEIAPGVTRRIVFIRLNNASPEEAAWPLTPTSASSNARPAGTSSPDAQ